MVPTKLTETSIEEFKPKDDICPNSLDESVQDTAEENRPKRPVPRLDHINLVAYAVDTDADVPQLLE